MSTTEPICVIIPTLATRARGPYLFRAIENVSAQTGVRAVPVVIANGPDADPEVLSELRRRSDLRLVELSEPGIPGALRAGRDRVDTALFSELDDDDELTLDAIQRRLTELQRNEEASAVISNGIIRGAGADQASIPCLEAVRRDPLRAILRHNWLLPGAALFRTARVDAGFFSAIPAALEWTYLGALLALRTQLVFIAHATVVHYTDRPFSIDRSRACALQRPFALRQLLTLELPPDVRDTVRKKIASEHHGVSMLNLEAGELRAAWSAHLRSLSSPSGWKYLPYTRHLLAGAAR